MHTSEESPKGEACGPIDRAPRTISRRGRGRLRSAQQLDCDTVWRAVEKQSFAVLSYVTPSGEPRSSGVTYKAIDRRILVPASDRSLTHDVARSGRVALLVPVRRDGFLSLFYPVPPATIGFRGAAVVRELDDPELRPVLGELLPLLPSEHSRSDAVIAVRPDTDFVTYGLGVTGRELRRPASLEEGALS